MPKDLHELPKIRDSISFLYFEHAVIEQDNGSIVVIQKDGRIPVPISMMTCLLLGPGTKVTHAAIKAMADNGCLVIWCGETNERFYASGMGETRSASNLLLQARLCMNTEYHMSVVRRMYEIRFPNEDVSKMTLQQLRGLEGVRVRQIYQSESKRCGVEWAARKYKQTNWNDSDEINRALSYANSVLYGVCHAAIVSLGFSTGLGFIHTGKLLSFVYDVADLYKKDTSIPAAFEAVQSRQIEPKIILERQVRFFTRKKIQEAGILRRIANDIAWIFDISINDEHDNDVLVGNLWDKEGETFGGINYSKDNAV